jgi:transposase InsO family protein
MPLGSNREQHQGHEAQYADSDRHWSLALRSGIMRALKQGSQCPEAAEAEKRYSPVELAMHPGIRDRPISAGCPWHNAYVERLIGSIRRECVDHLVIFNEGHLRRNLAAYACYYNETRSHLALNKDAPFGRLIQQVGTITGVPHLGGLHHSFVRI